MYRVPETVPYTEANCDPCDYGADPWRYVVCFHSRIRGILPFILLIEYHVLVEFFLSDEISKDGCLTDFWIQYLIILCRYSQPFPEPAAPVNIQRVGCASSWCAFLSNALAKILRILSRRRTWILDAAIVILFDLWSIFRMYHWKETIVELLLLSGE